jgi:hypothetical protein
MMADRDGAASTGPSSEEPPRNEPAGDGAQEVLRTRLWKFESQWVRASDAVLAARMWSG